MRASNTLLYGTSGPKCLSYPVYASTAGNHEILVSKQNNYISMSSHTISSGYRASYTTYYTGVTHYVDFESNYLLQPAFSTSPSTTSPFTVNTELVNWANTQSTAVVYTEVV